MSGLIAISPSGFAQITDEPLALLRAAGFEIRRNETGRALTEAEARDFLAGAVGVIAGLEPLTRDVLRASTSLRVIARVGVGVDNVDLAAAKELGIAVHNTPEAHVDAVAELTLAGILAALRHVPLADRAVRTKWKKPMGRLLRGRTIGLVGFGRVAKALVELLQPFAATILAHDIAIDRAFAAKLGVTIVELDEIVTRSDIVSLHVPYTPETRNIIGAAQLARMKPDAVLVNCSRGKLVDEDALHAHLVAHPEATCFLDCFAEEPYLGPLRELDNALLSPHIGGYARECRLRMEIEAVQHALAVLRAT